MKVTSRLIPGTSKYASPWSKSLEGSPTWWLYCLRVDRSGRDYGHIITFDDEWHWWHSLVVLKVSIDAVAKIRGRTCLIQSHKPTRTITANVHIEFFMSCFVVQNLRGNNDPPPRHATLQGTSLQGIAKVFKQHMYDAIRQDSEEASTAAITMVFAYPGLVLFPLILPASVSIWSYVWLSYVWVLRGSVLMSWNCVWSGSERHVRELLRLHGSRIRGRWPSLFDC